MRLAVEVLIMLLILMLLAIIIRGNLILYHILDRANSRLSTDKQPSAMLTSSFEFQRYSVSIEGDGLLQFWMARVSKF